MILPAKHLDPDRSLLGIGADVLAQLDEPRTVSELWERVRQARPTLSSPLSFDWFILTLSMLFAVSAVQLSNGIITANSK